MATKIRLSRHGKKGYAFYHIVIADARAPRDGRFIEKIGTYNPNTNPATIDLNFDRAVYWLGVGAQPTDTTRALLSYKGATMMHHLNGGVRKGAITEDQAKVKFEKWAQEKQTKIDAKISGLNAEATKSSADRMKNETAVKDAKAAAIASKLAATAKALAEEEKAAVAEEAPAVEEVVATEAVVTEEVAPAAEEVVAATEEAPAVEAVVTEEAPAEVAPATEEEKPAAE